MEDFVYNDSFRNNNSEEQQVRGWYRNKVVYYSILFASLLFLVVIAMEKTKFFMRIIPKLRGEVSLHSGFVITSISDSYPFIIRKDDPFVGDQLRFTGNVKSLFAQTANHLVHKGDVVAEIGSHFGYNAICIGNYLKNNGSYYAIEANTDVTGYLRKNIIINNLDGVVTIINKAISDQQSTYAIDDVLSYYHNPDGSYSSSKTIIVTSSTLDQELPGANLSLLLVDVPGTSLKILDGAQRILQDSQNIKVLANLDLTNVNDTTAMKEFNHLSSQGFQFFEVIAFDKYRKISSEQIINKKKLIVVISRHNVGS